MIKELRMWTWKCQMKNRLTTHALKKMRQRFCLFSLYPLAPQRTSLLEFAYILRKMCFRLAIVWSFECLKITRWERSRGTTASLKSSCIASSYKSCNSFIIALWSNQCSDEGPSQQVNSSAWNYTRGVPQRFLHVIEDTLVYIFTTISPPPGQQVLDSLVLE